MKLVFLSFLIVASFHLQVNGQTTPISIGETRTLHSNILQEDRILNIYLPLGYHPDSTQTYPVIYLLDGSMNEDFIHISGLVQFASFSWVDMLPETIVVGIANVDRKRDFTFPTNIESDKISFPTTGGSASFINFIEKELQPYISSSYKTNTKKMIIGQSLGGLLASEILLSKPYLFDEYLIISPSIWWDAQSLLSISKDHFAIDRKVYFAVGNEGRVMKRDAHQLHKKIKTNSRNNEHVYFDYLPKHDHGNILHLAIYKAFERKFSFR
jgi:hypothetical protein